MFYLKKSVENASNTSNDGKNHKAFALFFILLVYYLLSLIENKVHCSLIQLSHEYTKSFKKFTLCELYSNCFSNYLFFFRLNPSATSNFSKFEEKRSKISGKGSNTVKNILRFTKGN